MTVVKRMNIEEAFRLVLEMANKQQLNVDKVPPVLRELAEQQALACEMVKVYFNMYIKTKRGDTT